MLANVPSCADAFAHCQVSALALPSGSSTLAVSAVPVAGVSESNDTVPGSSRFVTETVTATLPLPPCPSLAVTVTA